MGQLKEVLKGVSLSEGAGAIVAEADRLLTEWPKTAAYMQYCESELKRLKSEKGISDAQDGLTFNETTGTYTAHDGLHYCTRCLSDDKRSPLKNGQFGWHCMVCKANFHDPARPYPNVSVDYDPLA